MRTRTIFFLVAILAISACHKQESANLSDGQLSLGVELNRSAEIGTESSPGSAGASTSSVSLRVAVSAPTHDSGHQVNVVLSEGESLLVVLPDGSRQVLEAPASLSAIGGGYVDYGVALPEVPREAFSLNLVLKRLDGRELSAELQLPPVLQVVSPDLSAATYNPDEAFTLAWESSGAPVTWVRLGGGGDCIDTDMDIEPTAGDATIPAGVSRTSSSCFDPDSTELLFLQSSSTRVATDYFRAVDVELSQWTSFRVKLAQ